MNHTPHAGSSAEAVICTCDTQQLTWHLRLCGALIQHLSRPTDLLITSADAAREQGHVHVAGMTGLGPLAVHQAAVNIVMQMD